MLNMAPAPEPGTSDGKWPQPSQDIPARAVTVQRGEERAFEDLCGPQTEEAVRDLIKREYERASVFREAAEMVKQASKEDNIGLYTSNNWTPMDAIGAGALAGVFAAFVAGMTAGTQYGVQTGLLWAAGGIAAGLLGGLIGAATIKMKDIISSVRKDARFYYRQIMFRATRVNVERSEQIRLAQESLPLLEEQQEKAEQNAQRLTDEWARAHGGPPRTPDQVKHDRSLAEIRQMVVNDQTRDDAGDEKRRSDATKFSI